MAAELLTDLSRATDANGNTLSGALWYFYATGTTTPQAVYTTAALDVAHANPVVADAGGLFPAIYFDTSLSYRGVQKTAAGVTLRDIDPISTLSGLIGDIVDEAIDSFAPVIVLDYAPNSTVRAQIVAGTYNTDIQAAGWLDEAADDAVAAGKPLHFPKGTYTWESWTPPANLTVTTAGKDTVFKQLDTGGAVHRMILVEQDGVRLWPGGCATFDGQIDVFPANANEFNSAVKIDPADGVTIKSCVIGDLYGRNIGGDVFTTGCSDTGELHHFQVGNIYGFNCYRNVCSITAGRVGRVGDIIDQGVDAGEGSGIAALFVELDATNNSPVESLDIGQVRGRVMNIAGQPLGVRVGSVRISSVDLDASRPMSSPEYDEAGLNKTTQPALFYCGLQYREVDSFHIGSAKIANCTHDAIRDIGEGSVNWSRRVSFGSLEIITCGATTLREITTQKTRSFTVGELKSMTRAANSNPIFIGGVAGSCISVDSAETIGRFATTAADLRVRDASTNADAQHIYYYCAGSQIDLVNVEVTGTAASMFLGATKVSTLKNCTIANAPTNFLGSGGDAAPNARLTNTTIGATTYRDRLYTAPVATVTDPSGGATVDAEARTAINALIDALQSEGIMV